MITLPNTIHDSNLVDEYLKERIKQLGISEKQNTFERVWYQPADERDSEGNIVTKQHEHRREYKIFDADEDGNIKIHYFNLLGQPCRWKKEDTKQTRDFYRTRLREPKGSMKYSQPQGSPVFPFFPPALIKKFQDKEQINTLFLVEGEFKAFKAAMVGIDIVGLPGIFGFYNGDIKGKLNEDIQELLITCQVQKIVLLFDADFLTVKWEEGKDLSKRPYSFYGSIKSFRESLQTLLDDSNVTLQLVYFMHIKTKHLNDAKGLDDLLSKYEDKSVEIQEDICQLGLAKKYFEGKQINDLNKDVLGWVYRDVGLQDEQEFYKTYKDFIGPHEFKFKRRRYMYDNEAREVKFVRHEDADKFMRIGPDWVKVVTKLNKFGEEEEEIVAWKISEISRDYKRYPDFLDQIRKYDDFCNEPSWNGDYQRVIKGCYNLCEPLRWIPKQGSIAHTIKFLKHIFQGSGKIILDNQGHFESEEAITGDQFTVAMDYLTILLRHPKNMLPVPILVSPENGTGKSTMLKYLQTIFGSNMVILGNDQFKMKFNGHYITKFIIAVDEGFLEVDKKAEKERLKQLVTADSVYLENKGMNVRKVNYYGKLWICSNDADRVMKIDEGESRWFVVRVPVIPIAERDPDLEIKLKAEIESFLYYLLRRPIHHPRTDRLWFKSEWFITDQFKIIVDATKNRLDRVFEDWIRDQFFTYRLGKLTYSITFLAAYFNDSKNNKYKVDVADLKTYLKSKGVLFDKTPKKFWMPEGLDMPDEGDASRPTRILVKQSNPTSSYVFLIENWLTPAEIEGILPLSDPNTKIVYPLGKTQPDQSNDDLPF